MRWEVCLCQTFVGVLYLPEKETITRMTMKQSVIIHRPAEDIFSYMIDSEHMVDWSSVVIAVRSAPSGPIQGGTTLRITTRFLGQWRETIYEVIECQPASHLTFKGMTGIVPCVFSYHFDATETGTIVSLEAMLFLSAQGGMPGLPEAVVENIFKRQIQHDLFTLKDVLEARAV
jgi:hypothetical protein